MTITQPFSIAASRRPAQLIRSAIDSVASSFPEQSHDIVRLGLATLLPRNCTIFAEQFAHVALRTIMRAQPGVYIDVGANRGAYLSTAIQAGCEDAYAIEPVSSLAWELSRKFRAQKVKVLEFAASDRDGCRNFYISRDCPELSTLDKSRLTDPSNFEKRRVIARTLDSLIPAEKHSKVTYLKVDTEFHELEVLRGSCSILEKSKPFVQFEADPSSAKNGNDKRNSEIFSIMENVGLSIAPIVHWLKGSSPNKMSKQEFLDSCRVNKFTDYLGFP